MPLTGDTGAFWFFDAANIELVVKVLDGRPVNGNFWLFYGALSNVEYTLTVTDTETGAVKTYSNPRDASPASATPRRSRGEPHAAYLQGTLLKVAGPVAGIVLVLIIARLRKLSLRDDLGFRWPPPRQTALWIVFWIAWMAVAEALINLFGMPDPEPWNAGYPALVIALRILAIGIVGPISEEMIMRGMILWRLRRTPLGDYGAIVLVAALWAVVHTQYGLALITLIFLNGLILGLARVRTRSLWVPILLHILANLFSIWQSLNA